MKSREAGYLMFGGLAVVVVWLLTKKPATAVTSTVTGYNSIPYTPQLQEPNPLAAAIASYAPIVSTGSVNTKNPSQPCGAMGPDDYFAYDDQGRLMKCTRAPLYQGGPLAGLPVSDPVCVQCQ